MDEFFVVFLGNFCRRLFFYFLEKMDQCENLCGFRSLLERIIQAAAKRRSLCVAEISKQDKKVIYSSVFFERERCFPFKRERSINTHVVCKKAVSRREGEGRNSFCFKCAIVLNYTRCATLCATLYMLCSSFFLRLDVATRTTLTGSRRRRRRRLRRRRIPQTPPLLRLLALCALFQTLAWI